MAFATHFPLSAKVPFQVFVQGIVLLVNVKRCFEQGLGLAVRAKSILASKIGTTHYVSTAIFRFPIAFPAFL
jgi:hypothetical protein